ncbi:MAG: hypothetical protein RJA70_3238 [Pseudomonadota bacterium]|jgi:flavin-dependent dehydrogenase
MNGAQNFDVAVIGGGPAGSATATLLAQSGVSTVIVEQATFPRFHIGESLLPGSMPILERLGVGDAVRGMGTPKHGAEFCSHDGALRRRYRFKDSLLGGQPSAVQIERAQFDALLLQNAVRSGATLVHARVTEANTEAGGARLQLKDLHEAGGHQELRCKLLIDASGQSSFLARRFGERVHDEQLKNAAVFTHYESAAPGPGDVPGDIQVILSGGGWWWHIPLPGCSSLGYVNRAAVLGGLGRAPEAFDPFLRSHAFLAERFASKRALMPPRTVADYSYVCTHLSGPGTLLVGDAAGFIDPVFSTGVHLALRGAECAAKAARECLAAPKHQRRLFAQYEARLLSEINLYRRFVRGFYDPAFLDLFLNPTDTFSLRSAVTSLLAGHGDGAAGLRHLGLHSRAGLFWLFHALHSRRRSLVAKVDLSGAPALPGS